MKILFLSNKTNRITNFSKPSIHAAHKLGYEFHLASNLSEFNDNVENYDITLHHIDIERNPFSLKNLKAYYQLTKLIRTEQFDAIHCNTPVGGVLGRLCGMHNGIQKVIYTAHGFHFYEGAPFLNNTLLKMAERLMARFTDVIITMNEEDYKNAQAFNLRNKGKVYYVPGVGVNTKRYQNAEVDNESKRNELSLSKNDFLLISAGQLIKRKNYSTAIKAIAQKEVDKRVQLLICGTGPELDSLMELAKDLNVNKRVHFLGYRKDIKELLAISDAFIFTSYQEGLPRSLMEAMSSGLPCIVSDIRGNEDLIQDKIGGYLNKSTDFVGFSKSVNKLVQSDQLRITMGKNNLNAIGPFDISNIKQEVKKIYQKELNF